MDLNSTKEKKLIKNEIFQWCKSIVLAFIVAIIITSFVKPTLVIGSSMYPTFKDKDYLFINRLAYKSEMPNRHDVIVFNSKLKGEKILIKRVIAIEGDRITIKNGSVYINEELQNEPFINQEDTKTLGNIDEIVPKNCVFAMGDNRNFSSDSRNPNVGFIDRSTIIGEVFIRLLPISQITLY
ncbi:MAG: signal peptidase [Clostridiaceae bacterium]|jgi:signal peptidase I|nr:signal peptidase [Clostridiaceae bacterium]